MECIQSQIWHAGLGCRGLNGKRLISMFFQTLKIGTLKSQRDRQCKQAIPFRNSQQTKADFLERLTHSESSGDSTAEITIADGRRYVGALQFGDARLQDYKKATGSSFTQDEFKANSTLQAKVAAWHIADIDKTIDGLGINTDGYDRDGLRAVAHLGGKSGMKKFVRSNGEYNPSDALGTSLQDYYDKFAVQS